MRDHVEVGLDSEMDDDSDAGPASPRSRQIKVRVTATMHRDMKIAAAKSDDSLDGLLREGMRCVLYGIEPRRRGIISKT